jgi:hypothetical protein
MSTQAAAVPDSYPVQWTGRLAIVIVPQHVGEFNAGQIREELPRVINRGATGLVMMLRVQACGSEAPGRRPGA